MRFQIDPETDEISEEMFEHLLTLVNDRIRNHDVKLDLYSGSQCHEDREIKDRVKYCVSFHGKRK